jgi:murein tripeptide amidase MpaA
LTGELSWYHDHTPQSQSAYFAYFPAYSYERHLGLISKCNNASPHSSIVSVESLGQSLDGREMECVKIGSGDKACWITHRQHPGENHG